MATRNAASRRPMVFAVMFFSVIALSMQGGRMVFHLTFVSTRLREISQPLFGHSLGSATPSRRHYQTSHRQHRSHLKRLASAIRQDYSPTLAAEAACLPSREGAQLINATDRQTDVSKHGVIPWLMGDTEDRFLESIFGARWMHSQWSTPRVRFSIEDCLTELKDFDASSHKELCASVIKQYGAHATVFENEAEPIPGGAMARRIWSGDRMGFWSVAVCRTCEGSLEKIEDHKFVAWFLKEHTLRCSDDLNSQGENWTFVLNRVHGVSEGIHILQHAVWSSFGLSGDFNLYLTPKGAQGLAPHVDKHDVFVIQQAGKKIWSLLEGDMQTKLKDVTLSPGDVLYLPQGVPHYAQSTADDSSLHITIGVYRGHFTIVWILAAWLELDGSTTLDTLSKPIARRIDDWQALLSRNCEGLKEANEPLSPAVSVPLLRAVDVSDVPDGIAGLAAADIVSVASKVALRLRESGVAMESEAARKLKELGALPKEAAAASLMRTIFAAREFRWFKHYRMYGAKKLRQSAVQSGSLPQNVGLQRCADAASLITGRGDLLLNGHSIQGLPDEAMPAVRFCLGRYTGAAGQKFLLKDVPGPRALVKSLIQTLLAFDGVTYA